MVLDILNKSTKPLKAREIHNRMNPKNSMFSLMRCLKRYYSFGLISRKKTNSFFVYSIKENGKRLKDWLKHRKELNQTRNFNRTSHYNRDVCY